MVTLPFATYCWCFLCKRDVMCTWINDMSWYVMPTRCCWSTSDAAVGAEQLLPQTTFGWQHSRHFHCLRRRASMAA